MATAGAVILEDKRTIDIVLAEDGKYYVDSTTTMDGVIVRCSTDGPFETEVKARQGVEWQYSVPLLEQLARNQQWPSSVPDVAWQRSEIMDAMPAE